VTEGAGPACAGVGEPLNETTKGIVHGSGERLGPGVTVRRPPVKSHDALVTVWCGAGAGPAVGAAVGRGGGADRDAAPHGRHLRATWVPYTPYLHVLDLVGV
jgi:hypothetical protein